MKRHRLARVAEVVREVAAETILFELQDPRIQGVTVTRTEVSADLQHAKVYVSLMGTKKQQDLCMHGLKRAAGYVQSKLASRMTTRFTPVITFILDEGVKNSIEVTRLINEALAQSPTGSSESNAPAELAATELAATELAATESVQTQSADGMADEENDL